MLVFQLAIWLAIAVSLAVAATVESPEQQGGPIIWTGPVGDQGKVVTLYGDAESIHKQILNLNPQYFDHHDLDQDASPASSAFESQDEGTANAASNDLHDNEQLQAPAITSSHNTTLPDDLSHLPSYSSSSSLDKRLKTTITCAPNTTEAYIPEVIDLIKYIASLRMNNATRPASTHSCRAAAGPGKCSQLAERRGSRIWLCNDNKKEGIACNCNYLATYARDILYKCRSNSFVKGQFFDTDGYNVVVGAWELY